MFNNLTQTGNWFVDKLSLYQSANSDNASIKNNFVIRQAEYEIIISELANKSDKDPLQHELILGRRGSGKSTLLRRIQAEIEENTKLQKKYVAINLAEEQAGIYRLFDLWDEVLKELTIKFNIQLQLKHYNEFDEDQDAYTRYLYETIHDILVKQKIKVVLLLDNFDRIVSNFTDDGNLLREILLNHNDIQIIAGSTRMDEHFWQYDKPFYEFFRRHRLEALRIEEIVELLNLWSKVMDLPQLANFAKKNIGKIEAIRILTDGLPRTLHFFIQILLQNANLYGYEYLRKVMDNVTALYQERLNNLPAAQRKIILEMAFVWEACATKELVEKCKMPSKLISANIKQLSDAGIIDTITTSKRNHLYRIAERFFNMWLIVTQGNPEQKRKAKWLSIFLEAWYDGEELKELATDHIGKLENNRIGYDKALVFTKAFSQSKYVTTEQRDRLIDLTNALQPYGIKDTLIELPKKYNAIASEIEKLLDEKKFEEAHKLVDGIENEEDGIKFYVKGTLFHNQENNSEAERYYLLAIEKGHIEALVYLAYLHYEQQNFIEAEKYSKLAIDKGHVGACNNLANMFEEQQKYVEAEKYYLLAIKNGDVDALYNLALLYDNQQKYKEARKYYLLAIEKEDVEALNRLANLFRKQGNYADAEKYYLLAVEKGDNKALNNLGNLYQDQADLSKAEKYYLLAIKNKNVAALLNLALFYYNENIKKLEAKALILKYISIEKDNKNNSQEISIIIDVWNGVLENLNQKMEKLTIINNYENLEKFLIHLLYHEQLNLVLNLFTHDVHGIELQKRYNPLYYAVQILTNKMDNNLLLRIPPEIMSTVKDIVENVKENQNFYAT
jgi:TPR repeat protein